MRIGTKWLILAVVVIVGIATFAVFNGVRNAPAEMDGQTNAADADTKPPNTTGPDASPDNAS
jgi:hypothetical protein